MSKKSGSLSAKDLRTWLEGEKMHLQIVEVLYCPSFSEESEFHWVHSREKSLP